MASPGLTQYLPWHMVRDYGATGTGNTNDAPAFAAAMTAASLSGGGTVIVSPGRYRLDSTLTWSGLANVCVWLGGGVTLTGAGTLPAVAANGNSVVDTSGGWYRPAEVQIATQTLASTVSAVTFDAIPGTFRHLRVLMSGRVTAAVIGGGITLVVNQDSAANYWNNDNGAGQAFAYIGIIHGNNNYTTTANLTDCYILNYSQAAYKGIIARGGWNNSSGGYALALSSQPWQEWRNTATVSRLDLSVGGGSLAAGTVISLNGIY